MSRPNIWLNPSGQLVTKLVGNQCKIIACENSPCSPPSSGPESSSNSSTYFAIYFTDWATIGSNTNTYVIDISPPLTNNEVPILTYRSEYLNFNYLDEVATFNRTFCNLISNEIYVRNARENESLNITIASNTLTIIHNYGNANGTENDDANFSFGVKIEANYNQDVFISDLISGWTVRIAQLPQNADDHGYDPIHIYSKDPRLVDDGDHPFSDWGGIDIVGTTVTFPVKCIVPSGKCSYDEGGYSPYSDGKCIYIGNGEFD